MTPTLRLRPGSDAIEGTPRGAAADALGAAYAYLQIWIGMIAFTMPIVLVLGNWALDGSWNDSLQGSISAYYYTQMHAWFIGSQFALGVFFLSYNYKALDRFKWDNRWANVACLAMVIVALIPTVQPGKDSTFGSTLHLASAALVFGILAWFSGWRFTMSNGPMTTRKERRNTLYRICGGIIAVSLAAAGLCVVLDTGKGWRSTLVFESIAIFAFGASWLVKGGFLGILADRPTER